MKIDESWCIAQKHIKPISGGKWNKGPKAKLEKASEPTYFAELVRYRHVLL